MVEIFFYDSLYKEGRVPCEIVVVERLTGEIVSSYCKDYSGGKRSQRFEICFVGVDNVPVGLASFHIEQANGKTLKWWNKYPSWKGAAI